MAIIKFIKNEADVDVSYWNIDYFEVVKGEKLSIRLNGYTNKQARDNGALAVEQKKVVLETTKEEVLSYGSIYSMIKNKKEFIDAVDDI